jgi:hypothetical protein
MHARFIIHRNYVYQIVVTGPLHQLNATVSDPFLQSFTSDFAEKP